MSKRQKRALRPNAAARAVDRDAVRDKKTLERLDKVSPGGAPDRPIEIVSPSEVEVRAEGDCPICGGRLKLLSHDAETVEGARLRVARLVCSVCRAPRARYFAVRGASVLN